MSQTLNWITMNMLCNGEEKYLKESTELRWICFTMEKKMPQTIHWITINMFYNGEENTSNNRLNYNEYVLQWRRKCLKQSTELQWICFTMEKKMPQTIHWITINMFYNGEENTSNNRLNYNEYVLQWRRKCLKQSTELQWICFTMEKKIPQTVDWITMNMFYNGEENASNNRLNYNEYVLQWRRKYLEESTELQWICFTMEKKMTKNNRLNYNEYVLQWRRKYLKQSTELQWICFTM